MSPLLAAPVKVRRPFRLKRIYQCQCGRPIFFRNSQCLACGAPLGYEPELGRLGALQAGPSPDTWKLAGTRGGLYRRCANLDSPAGCNWLVKVDPRANDAASLCQCCRLNRTIPDLSLAENGVLWGRIEIAKRQVISALVSLRLPVESLTENPQKGLAFDLLRSPAQGPRVLTGHAEGIITLNIEEADDATRERVREQMGEPYRTLVGHFRHETGHYYWDRLIAGADWLYGFRELFGDETADYGQALQRHHQQGPPVDWPSHFVSAYASSHPWEDWAETWAHYLHMVDTLATAQSFRLDKSGNLFDFERFTMESLYRPQDPQAGTFLEFLNDWLGLTAAMNELTRSMGQPDFYPFALPRAAVAKLQFIHNRLNSGTA
jgi:hypothetical protein